MKVVVVVVVAIVLGFLLVRDLPYLFSAQGHCMVAYQPTILIGGSPSWETDLVCAGVQ